LDHDPENINNNNKKKKKKNLETLGLLTISCSNKNISNRERERFGANYGLFSNIHVPI
jgi:hypothetical protein